MYYLVSKYVSSAPTVVEGESHVPVWLCPRPLGSWKRRYSTIRWVLNRLEVELLNKFAQKNTVHSQDMTWRLFVRWLTQPSVWDGHVSVVLDIFNGYKKALFNLTASSAEVASAPCQTSWKWQGWLPLQSFSQSPSFLGLSKVGLGAISQGLSL